MNATSFKAGRVVVLGQLVQRTDMSVGPSDGDAGLCVDGLGRPTLFGTTIAGALFDTMRRCGHTLPPALTTTPTTKRHDGPMIESCLITWNSHGQAIPTAMPQELRRQHVAIRQDSGTAADEHLFSHATITAGTRWPLILELDLLEWSRLTQEYNGDWAPSDAVAVLRQALGEWVDGRCWLGSSVSRGLGWLNLEGLQLIHVPDAHALTWHERLALAQSSPWDPTPVRECLLSPDIGAVDLTDWAPDVWALPKSSPTSPWIYIRMQGTLSFGEPRSDGWGLDTLSHTASNLPAVNHHASALAHTAAPDGDSTFFNRRQTTTEAATRSGFAPDKTVALTPRLRGDSGHTDWQVEPFIAGSAIAGPIRHELSRRHRLNGLTVTDPVTGHSYTDHNGPPSDISAWMGERFGAQDARSSMLLVRDAFLCERHRDSWWKYQSEHHAEDEFRGSTFGGSKFNREVLAQACFEWEIVLAAPPEQQASLEALERELSSLLVGHQLSVGGAVWRGHGRGLWKITDHRRIVAGEAWRSLES